MPRLPISCCICGKPLTGGPDTFGDPPEAACYHCHLGLLEESETPRHHCADIQLPLDNEQLIAATVQLTVPPEDLDPNTAEALGELIRAAVRAIQNGTLKSSKDEGDELP